MKKYGQRQQHTHTHTGKHTRIYFRKMFHEAAEIFTKPKNATHTHTLSISISVCLFVISFFCKIAQVTQSVDRRNKSTDKHLKKTQQQQQS